MSAVRRIMGAVGSRAASPVIGDRARERSASPEAATLRATSVRVFRQAPSPGSGAAGTQSGPELAGRSDRRSIEAGSGTGGPAAGSRRGTALERARMAQNVNPRSAMPGSAGGGSASGSPIGSKSDSRRTLTVNAAGVATPVGSAKASSGSEASKGRHSKRVVAESAGSRYEPRAQSHSASLRDGPPKTPRERRRTQSGQQRRFREYSSVKKDGVTVLVPNRRR